MASDLEDKESSSDVKIADTEAVAPIDDYPHGVRLAVIVISLMLAMFLISLDNVSGMHPNLPPSSQAVPRPSLARLFPRSRMSFVI